MMIKEYNQLIQWKYMHVEKTKIVSEKEEIKFNNMIKQCKND